MKKDMKSGAASSLLKMPLQLLKKIKTKQKEKMLREKNTLMKRRRITSSLLISKIYGQLIF